MKKYLIILLSTLILGSCADKQKEFSSIQKGMTKDEVLQKVGEPTSKRDVLVAEVWKYDTADRAVIFRNGIVYDIITSAEARIDSIETTLKKTGRDLKDKLKSTGDVLDSTGHRLKDKILRDSANKN